MNPSIVGYDEPLAGEGLPPQWSRRNLALAGRRPPPTNGFVEASRWPADGPPPPNGFVAPWESEGRLANLKIKLSSHLTVEVVSGAITSCQKDQNEGIST